MLLLLIDGDIAANIISKNPNNAAGICWSYVENNSL